MERWCICNNTGVIYEDWSGNYALVCPICNKDGNKINCQSLIGIILRARRNMKKIIRFRLNTYQMICLSESMASSFVYYDDNKFYGIPIEIDNDVKEIVVDYVK